MLGKIKTKQEKSGGKWESYLETLNSTVAKRERGNTAENPLLEVMCIIYLSII